MNATAKIFAHDDTANRDLFLDLYEPHTQARPLVENFIHRVFARAYGADLQHFLPRLMALHGKDYRIEAALGLRSAGSGPLFLENYLDQPVEHAVSELHGATVERSRIMEVGNLASVHRGGLRQLIIALTSYLHGAGYEWVVFTAVPIVRKAFAAMELNLQPLAAADPARLSDDELACWGRYYDSGPLVVAGRVEHGYQRIGELIELEKLLSLSCSLWEYAFNVGYRQRQRTDNALQWRRGRR